MWISVKDKVFAVRSVRRIPEEHRWVEDCVKWNSRTSWNRYEDCKFADVDVPEEVQAEPKSDPVVSGPVFIETSAKASREFYIKKEDADKFGYTQRLRRVQQLVQRIRQTATY